MFVLGILFFILIFVCLIALVVFHNRKVIAHWRYLKKAEGKFPKYNSYLETAFSFDFSILPDLFNMLLPIFTVSDQYEKTPETEELARRVQKYIKWFWSLIGTIIFSFMMILILAFFEPNLGPNDHFSSVVEIMEDGYQCNPSANYIGEPDGLQHNHDGKWNLTEKAYFKDGYFHGEYTGYYKNGTIKEKCTYDMGIKTGTYSYYYESGKILLRAYYNNGCLEGQRIIYYENGKVFEQSNWANGTASGPYVIYDEDGRMEQSGTY